jgi:hypothetical protein
MSFLAATETVLDIRGEAVCATETVLDMGWDRQYEGARPLRKLS